MNPHAWRKFSQAQDNLRKRLGFHLAPGVDIPGNVWKFSGKRIPNKAHRRVRKWARVANRWMEKLFE